MKKLAVIALGGNAIQQKGERGAFIDHLKNITKTAEGLLDLLADKNLELAFTHGNGPQVGNIFIQNVAGRDIVPEMPMFVCGAMSQGQIGYLIQATLTDLCRRNNISREIATIITRVEVNKNDPAFQKPSKPVGPFYSEKDAKTIALESGYVFEEDAGRGWRRMVPSPDPVRILEIDAIKKMIGSGITAIACGGGGIPVMLKSGGFQGIDAVIDKDKASSLLADSLEADLLIILTPVEKVFLNYGSANQKPVDHMNLKEAKAYLNQGHFAEGSMKPKIEAVIDFIRKNNKRRALITSPNKLKEVLMGGGGTWVGH